MTLRHTSPAMFSPISDSLFYNTSILKFFVSKFSQSSNAAAVWFPPVCDVSLSDRPGEERRLHSVRRYIIINAASRQP